MLLYFADGNLLRCGRRAPAGAEFGGTTKNMATIDLLSGFRLTGKRALITGAGGGIGRALVALFQAAGASVMGADIRASAMDGLELDDRLVFDLTDPDAIEAAVAPLEDAGKALDM